MITEKNADKIDVLCIGLMTCDIIAKPVYDDVMDKDVSLVEHMEMSNGGDAMNVAVNLSVMGTKTAIAGRIGRDVFGDFLMSTASERGLNIAGIVRDETCGTAVCITLIKENGERSFVYHSGAGSKLCKDDLNLSLLKEAKLLAVGGAGLLPSLDGQGLVDLLKIAQDIGVETCVDVSGELTESFKSNIEMALAHTDIFIPSDYQARFLTGLTEIKSVAEKLMSYGPKIVVIKCGHEGSFLATKDIMAHIPPFNVETKDSAGAGDAFVAGFISSYLNGEELLKCCRFANASGALCVTEMGTTSRLRTFEVISNFAK